MTAALLLPSTVAAGCMQWVCACLSLAAVALQAVPAGKLPRVAMQPKWKLTWKTLT